MPRNSEIIGIRGEEAKAEMMHLSSSALAPGDGFQEIGPETGYRTHSTNFEIDGNIVDQTRIDFANSLTGTADGFVSGALDVPAEVLRMLESQGKNEAVIAFCQRMNPTAQQEIVCLLQFLEAADPMKLDQVKSFDDIYKALFDLSHEEQDLPTAPDSPALDQANLSDIDLLNFAPTKSRAERRRNNALAKQKQRALSLEIIPGSKEQLRERLVHRANILIDPETPVPEHLQKEMEMRTRKKEKLKPVNYTVDDIQKQEEFLAATRAYISQLESDFERGVRTDGWGREVSMESLYAIENQKNLQRARNKLKDARALLVKMKANKKSGDTAEA